MGLNRFSSIIFLLFSCVVSVSVLAKEAKELYWEDLAPEGFNELQPPANLDHQKSMVQLQPDAPVVEELDGEYVRIPGFVVPLEGTVDETTELLLVPYFGACIHVPPPPSNQIVHVKFKKGIAIHNMYDAVWITGTLSTKGWSGDIASVGYTLTGESVAPFDAF